MQLIDKDTLLSRLTLSILFTALAVGLIASELFYRVIYQESLKQAQAEISTLFETVAATSSIAAFLNDSELANEVVDGLEINGVIRGAKLETSEMAVVSESFDDSEDVYEFAILSPFSEQSVGTLLIIRDADFIAKRAENNAAYNTQALIIQAIAITVVTILIVFLLVSKPITFISDQLSKIAPPSKDRLRYPAFHRKGELGSLIKDVNALLYKTEKSLNFEQQYKKEIEVLEQRLRLVFENASNPIVITDPMGNLMLSNQAFKALSEQNGLPMQKNVGLYLNALFEESSALESTFSQQLAIENSASGEFKLKSYNHAYNARWFQVIATNISSDDFKDYLEISLHDITSKKLESSEHNQIEPLIPDPLTGALNRQSLFAAMQLMKSTCANFAVIYLNINEFKKINQRYGMQKGDEALRQFYQRLTSRTRKDDLICRWESDRFIIVLAQVTHENAMSIAADISRELCRPLKLLDDEKECEICVRVGLSLFPDNTMDNERLISLAEAAMHNATKHNAAPPSACLKLAG